MGEVLLAFDTRLDRHVAIKRVLGKSVRNAKALQRFLNGAKRVASLNHPNIVQVYDFGMAKDGPFMILEYVRGASLLDRCLEGVIPLDEAVEIICQLCDGLGKAHDAGVVHRDIKPANILMTEEGRPKLNDFDLAKVQTTDSGMTMQGAILGTLDFMPPEQRRNAALVDHRSDLWSLAATFYQIVTGKSPKIIRFSDVPKSLHDVLGKALEEEKSDRYQTPLEFREAIRTSLSTRGGETATAVELGAGECPKCHTPNESQRKFCRECAASLRVPCLECKSEIPIWDKVCGECG
ncbi:MAG: protein kinase [Planctomycetaceae bacterium]|nr:protein kinase [Planctomycetaceae bacterium]